MTTQHRTGTKSGGSGGAIVVCIGVLAGAGWFANQAGLIGSDTMGAASSADTSSSSNIGAKLLKEAKKHDDEAYVYGGGHPISSYKPGSGLDCSSLVNVVVFEVTGVREDITARDFRNSRHWKPVKKRDARPGDLLYILKEKHPSRSDDHVVFVVKNGGNGQLTIFEAYSSRVPFGQQIRQSPGHRYSEYDGALRWRGK